MKRSTTAIVAILACLSVARAEDDAACAVAQQLVFADYGLPRAADAIKKTQRLDIVVVGTGSSILVSPGGSDLAYPARLREVLSRRLPEVQTKVVSYAKPRRTAADMAAEFDNIFKAGKPSLVIWQVGTFDAMRGIDPDEFHASVSEGIEKLQAAGADVVLMNMQYSPRTESMIAVNIYAENMRVAAHQREALLFDRFGVMRHWSELGTFDLHAATKNVETAAHVHECIAQLLGDLILDGIQMSQPQMKVLQ